MFMLRLSPLKKLIFLIVPSLRCLSFSVQNDVCAVFDTRRLFSHSAAEGGKVSQNFKSDFKTCTNKCDFVT